MSDVFREVDEELRRERVKVLWDRFGPYILGVALLIIVGVSAYRGWEYWESRRAAETGDRFLAALQLAESGRAAEAEAAFRALESEGSGGYPILARLQLAGNLATAGDIDGAVAAYDAVAGSSAAPALLRELARLRAAVLLADRLSPQEMQSRIGDLAEPEKPFRITAREMLGLTAVRVGETETARRHYEAIIGDPAATDMVRQRALVMLALLAARVGTPAAPPPAESAPAESTPAPSEPAQTPQPSQ